MLRLGCVLQWAAAGGLHACSHRQQHPVLCGWPEYAADLRPPACRRYRQASHSHGAHACTVIPMTATAALIDSLTVTPSP